MKYVKEDFNKVIPIRKERAIRFISLFAGCGGSSYGYQQAGLKELLAIEWNKHARETFELNFPEVPIHNVDISKLTGPELLNMIGLKSGDLDLFDASPPCQDFSTANSNRGIKDDRNELYFRTIELIDFVQPKVFVIENVEGMKKGEMIPVWNRIVRRMKKLNYRIEFKVIKTEQYGVPQERRRVIVIGVRGDIQDQFQIDNLFPAPTNSDSAAMSVKNHFPYLIGFSSGQYDDRFITSDRPMCTITKTPSAWVYESDGIRRKPTIEELKVLSSFPESFILTGSDTQQWARIGNAVPPKITEALGLHIRNTILTQEVLAHFNEEETISLAA